MLRGGKHGTNFDRDSIEAAGSALRESKLPSGIMVDCSHANSDKVPEKQEIVMKDIAGQVKSGDSSIIGFMIESHLNRGNQKISDNMEYGVSVTDSCLDWENTERIIKECYQSI